MVVCLVNIFGVRWFGESEFVFSTIKIALISGLIIVGLVIDLGGGPDHDRRGFRVRQTSSSFDAIYADAVHSTGKTQARLQAQGSRRA